MSARPIDPADVRATLRAAGLRARHALSQNFLADADVLSQILEAADPEPGGRVLEIGPGLGLLTAGLLDAGASVTAVELDRGLAMFLRERFEPALEEGRLQLIEGDALDQDLTSLVEPPYDVVANLPYHITSPILHALLGTPPRPRRLVLMVQREVAERIAAPPGKMSYLSVFVQYHARVRVAFRVPPEAFEPEPAVESAVIVVEPFDADDRLSPEEEDQLWRLVQAAFRERRKMLHNVLARQLPFDAARVAAALETAGIDPDRRPQTVAVGEWLALKDALGPIGADWRGRPPGTGRPAVPDAHLTPVVRLAPAKLNLTLAVVGRREDGFHDLHSVFVPLALADRLSLAPARAAAGGDTLHVTGFDAGPVGDNLVLRAIAAARAAVGEGPGRPATPSLAARLEKHIPVAAGLGGGSSDAAAAFDGALEAWGAELDPERRAHAAASIGSDVPFFLRGVPALVEGRGERLTPLKGVHGHPGILLVTPSVAVRTPDVFAVFDAIRGQGRRLDPDVVRAPGPGARATACPRPT